MIIGLVENGQPDKIMTYVAKVDYSPDWGSVIRACIGVNPAAAQQLAITAIGATGAGGVDVVAVTELFLQMNMVAEATGFALKALEGDGPSIPFSIPAYTSQQISPSHPSRASLSALLL